MKTNFFDRISPPPPPCVSLSHQKLTNVRIMKENMRTGNLPANMKKNRVLQIIPCKDYAETRNTSIMHHVRVTSKYHTAGDFIDSRTQISG